MVVTFTYQLECETFL